MNFQKEDRIKCINNNGTPLIDGNIYIVECMFGVGRVRIKREGQSVFFVDRFELIHKRQNHPLTNIFR